MTVGLLLAAGSSSRMGEPKMLLAYKGKTLLQHIIDEVKGLENNSLLVITGCYHELLVADLTHQGIDLVKNEQWQHGMGSTVSAGVRHILQHYASAESVLILTCDQPFISTALLKQMIDAKATSGKAIAACAYGGSVGVPVLFDKKYFSLLLSLKGNEGAKKIVAGLMDDVVEIDFPKGKIDIDEPGDYARLMQENGHS